MSKKLEEKIYYYKDELNDSFTEPLKNPKVIDENYKYVHKNIFYRFASFILYRFVALPISYLYLKCKFHLSYKNKKAIKKFRNKGIFIYGNHTQQFLDPFSPAHLTFPTKPYIIAHPDNVSLKVIGKCMPMLGALPLPSNIKATKNFIYCINYLNKKGKPIMIYPEAKIWPYYTKIRPFISSSFNYPVKTNSPVFAMTTTYQKRKNPKKVKVTIYVDGPFYSDENLTNNKDKEQNLRDKVYNQMVERTKNNNVEFIKYKKIDENN